MLFLRKRALASLAVIGLALTMAGCSGDATGPLSSGDPSNPMSDQEEIRSLVTSDPAYADYFDLETAFDTPAGGPALPIGLSPVGSLTGWHRERTGVSHEVTVHILDALATVEATATISGNLVLREMVDGSIVRHSKPLVDVARRYATFARSEKGRGLNQNRWHLVSLSNIEVESRVDDAAPTVAIQSVLLEPSGSASILITDPSVEVQRADIMRLLPGQEVAITVMAEGATALGFVHSGGRNAAERSRQPLELQPDGSFRGMWTVPEHGGRYHVALDLLTEGSLMESDPAVAPYDSNQWSLLYRVSTRESLDDDDDGGDD